MATIVPDSPHTRVRVRMHVAEAQERAHLLRSSPGSLPQGDGDMCLSFLSFFFYEREDCGNSGHVRAYTHAALVVRAREDGGIPVVFGKRGLNAGGRRTVGGAKGGRTRQGWEDDRTYGHHKAANPWEYRACASGPARGLHELYGLSFSLRVPLFFLKPLHARHSGPRTEISFSTRGCFKRTTSPASILPPTARAGRVSVA